MVSSIKLEVKPNNCVLVTNIETQEQIKVTFSFLQKVTKSSLSILAQYKYYELILEAEKHWNNIRKFQSGKEIEIIKKIELEELENIANITSSVRQKEREKTAAKQQHWNEIAAYNKAQRQLREKKIAEQRRQLTEQAIAKQQKWNKIAAYDQTSREYIEDDDDILLQSQQSYNRTLIALEYADYCLKHDYRYKFETSINQNAILQTDLEYLFKQEQEIIDLNKIKHCVKE